jgi:hypothetical protein
MLVYIWMHLISHRGINVDQQSKPRNKCKYSILYLHLFRGFEYRSTLIPWSTLKLSEMCILTAQMSKKTYLHIYIYICIFYRYIHLILYTSKRFYTDQNIARVLATPPYIYSTYRTNWCIDIYSPFLPMLRLLKAYHISLGDLRRSHSSTFDKYV